MIKYAGTNSYSVSFVHVHYIFGSRPADTLYVACNAFHCVLAKSDTLKWKIKKKKKKNEQPKNNNNNRGIRMKIRRQQIHVYFILFSEQMDISFIANHSHDCCYHHKFIAMNNTVQSIPSTKTYNSFE